ncbi:integrase, catalytic region, zinc finger, CCHC-type containing protein [Tanacetum coccineum]
MVEEVSSLKKVFKQKENKYLKEPLDMKALKEKDLIKMKSEALKEQTTTSRPIKALTVYPPNTPTTLGIQKALTKEIKEMKELFEELEAEVDQHVVNRKHDEIERKNLLITNDNLISHCLSKDMFYITRNSEVTVSRFTEMHDPILPTGRIFTLGEQCPLTRFTKPKVVPAKKTKNVSTSKFVITKKVSHTSQKPLTRYQRRNQQYQAVPVSLPTSPENQAIAFANQQEPNQNWGSNFSNSPSSSVFKCRVYYVEGLGHNLFSVGQFCDSDLEGAFRKHSFYVRDTDGVELIKGSRGSNLYTISVEDMMKSSPICLLSKASKNKSWLWHQHLNHLNIGTINDLARKDLVRGLPRLKFEKDHL